MIDAILEPVLLICIVFLFISNVLMIWDYRRNRKKGGDAMQRGECVVDPYITEYGKPHQ